MEQSKPKKHDLHHHYKRGRYYLHSHKHDHHKYGRPQSRLIVPRPHYNNPRC